MTLTALYSVLAWTVLCGFRLASSGKIAASNEATERFSFSARKHRRRDAHTRSPWHEIAILDWQCDFFFGQLDGEQVALVRAEGIGKLSIADLKLFVWFKGLRTGNLDHVPTDLPERHAPGLVALADRVGEKVAGYYASRG